MVLQPIVSPIEIARAINDFPAQYHQDFLEARRIGQLYVLEREPGEETSRRLAASIHGILRRWGAGVRRAPAVRSKDKLYQALRSRGRHSALAELSRAHLSRLSLAGRQRTIDGRADGAAIGNFGSIVLSVLRDLSLNFFDGNRNVTYPMKAALLITGLMPAFDSQVRSGLSRSGFEGMASTQFLVPSGERCANARKVTRLPFILGQCWSEFGEDLRTGIRRSGRPELIQEPGRVFDVLFFMQGSSRETLRLRLQKNHSRWYDVA